MQPMPPSRSDPPPFDGKAFARELSTAPGVYRMVGADDQVLYVGKASALRNRVSSYFNATPKSARIMSMLAQTVRMEVTVTRTESEALILENELIKSLKPRYNVLLRDDKSYPYVLLTREQWPRIAMHRGPRSIPGRYFGPYASVGAVRDHSCGGPGRWGRAAPCPGGRAGPGGPSRAVWVGWGPYATRST